MTSYAGIGSRKTPKPILELMTMIATSLSQKGHRLRSGGAEGADQAFELGAGGFRTIYIPWFRYNEYDPTQPGIRIGATKATMPMVAKWHPGVEKLSNGALKLHARNVAIMMSHTLDDPVEFVVCWTPGGKLAGGTGMALRMATDLNVNVYNLAIPAQLEAICELAGIIEEDGVYKFLAAPLEIKDEDRIPFDGVGVETPTEAS